MNDTRVFVKRGTRSPLLDPELRDLHRIALVAEPGEAEWIIASRVKSLIPYILRFPGKRHLVYTNEPRYSRSTSKRFRLAPLLPAIEIMNVFTGDVFWHNFHFLGSYHFDISCNLDIDLHRPLSLLSKKDLGAKDRRPVAAFFTYRAARKTRYRVLGADRDLELARCSCATALFRAGLCDIYGSDWPPGMSREASGYASSPDAAIPWWSRKLKLLRGYRYNLCLENTIADYYCTEKIWHAIQADTLPVYWGGNTTIFEIFPRDSFIDLAALGSPGALIDYLQRLSDDDYLERVNRCREVFNRCIEERRQTVADDPRLHMTHLTRRLRP
jgi:hypothetical protein